MQVTKLGVGMDVWGGGGWLWGDVSGCMRQFRASGIVYMLIHTTHVSNKHDKYGVLSSILPQKRTGCMEKHFNYI